MLAVYKKNRIECWVNSFLHDNLESPMIP
jgi:hypothetical protein